MKTLKEAYSNLYYEALISLKEHERQTGEGLRNAADTIAKLRWSASYLNEKVAEIAEELGIDPRGKDIDKLIVEIKVQLKILKIEMEELKAVLAEIEAESQWLR